MTVAPRRRVLIMGAAGRDFHDFNVVYRDDPAVEVVAFTAAQIPFIDDRVYPPDLAGPSYPDGIPIHGESGLVELVGSLGVDEVVFAYSDVPHEYVMHQASKVLAAGADFTLLGPAATMLSARVPVVSVCAVRTGAGKSQTTRAVAQILRAHGKQIVVVRHPMPYGNLSAQRVQRFAGRADLDSAHVTIEEREEYEPHLDAGTVVYAGVDYGAILERAQRECDILLWDGGNNDFPFYAPDLAVCVVDPLRSGDELTYHPGEVNLRMADVVVVNKVDSADPAEVAELLGTVKRVNDEAVVVMANSKLTVDDPGIIAGKRVLVIEDGPTLTHGGMKFGAGVVAARRGDAAEIIDPRAYATGTLAATYEKYDVGPVLPAMGYADLQLDEMKAIIDAAPADLVVIASPIDLRHLLDISKPAVRVGYELEILPGSPTLEDVLEQRILGEP